MVERMIRKNGIEAVIFERDILSFGPPGPERAFRFELGCFFTALVDCPGGVVYSCNMKTSAGEKYGHVAAIAHSHIEELTFFILQSTYH